MPITRETYEFIKANATYTGHHWGLVSRDGNLRL